jgi:hypothetical protein
VPHKLQRQHIVVAKRSAAASGLQPNDLAEFPIFVICLVFSLPARATNGVSCALPCLILHVSKGERAAIIPRQVLTLTIYRRRGLCGRHQRRTPWELTPEGGPTCVDVSRSR